MLSSEQIEENKERLLNLLEGIVVLSDYSVPEDELCEEDKKLLEHKDKLIKYLINSDFFTAPASTKYHLACEGGLCQHSLNVYDNLVMLVEQKGLSNEISNSSILLVSLLHDISKAGLYKKDFRNKKVYWDGGSKSDNGGRFDWVAEECYSIREDEFVFGNHEQTSEFKVRTLFPLTVEESVAILHHMGGMSWDSTQTNMARIYGNYKLATLLHLADMLATYIDEGNDA